MKRLLLNLLTTLSLLLLLLTIAQWTRSYYLVDDLLLGSHLNSSPLSATGYRVISYRGGWALCTATLDTTGLSYTFPEDARVIVDNLHANHRLHLKTTNIEAHFGPIYLANTLGFGYQKEPMLFGDGAYTTISIPFYLPALLSSLLPLHFLYRLHKTYSQKSRLAKNLCPTCSYDLRASNSRCPECGTPIPTPQSSPLVTNAPRS